MILLVKIFDNFLAIFNKISRLGIIYATKPTQSVVFLDVETTGLDPQSDEVLQIGVVDEHGAELINTPVKPVRCSSWPEAQSIHHIAPADVRQAPTLEDITPAVIAAVRGKVVVIYNRAFDASFLHFLAEVAHQVECCMLAYADYVGEWDDYYGNNRWHKLEAAAAHVGHISSRAHDAVADALACRAVWRFLRDPEEQVRVLTWRAAKAEAAMIDIQVQALIVQEQVAAQALQRRMELFWMRWLRFPLFLAGREVPCWRTERTARTDSYARLFFGVPVCVLQHETSTGATLPRYHSRCLVPAHLKAMVAFAKRPAWFRKELQPVAVLVTPGSFSWLYNIAQEETILAKYPLRRPYKPEPGRRLMTRTALRGVGMSTKEIAALSPCQEIYHQLSGNWIPLFDVPDSPRVVEISV